MDRTADKGHAAYVAWQVVRTAILNEGKRIMECRTLEDFQKVQMELSKLYAVERIAAARVEVP